jgi:hypothetical protein
LAGILTQIGHHPLPGFLGIAAAGMVLALIMTRPTQGLGGILTDAAVVTIFAMFFAKFAFINYYFVAYAAMWTALAAGSSDRAGDWQPETVPGSAPAPALSPVGQGTAPAI